MSHDLNLPNDEGEKVIKLDREDPREIAESRNQDLLKPAPYNTDFPTI